MAAKRIAKVKTASIQFGLDELMTLHQVLSQFNLNGPVDQLAEIIPRFESLKQKVTLAANDLQSALNATPAKPADKK